MRLVDNLEEIIECPNCESRGLILTKNEFGTPFKQCCVCTETIYEHDDTRSAPSKEEVLFELREMADVLPHWAESNRDTLLMQMIRDIFNKLIDYLEEN